jgi:hypothetical protein
MGFLSKLAKSVVSVAITPVDIVVDIATLGGVLDDKPEPHTIERLRKAKEALDDSIDDLGDGDIL